MTTHRNEDRQRPGVHPRGPERWWRGAVAALGRRPRLAVALLAFPVTFTAGACSAPGGEAADGAEHVRATSEFLTVAASPAPTFDPRKSLLVTDVDIVSGFTLSEVMNTLVQQAMTRGAKTPTTALALFQQMFNTEQPPQCTADAADTALGRFNAANQAAKSLAPAGAINGWPAECPRPEASEADTDAGTFAGAPDGGDSGTAPLYMATTLSNRFDLAPADGSNCGEYRVNFARSSGITSNLQRLFIAFEARVPNPQPALGLAGCKPIVSFWQGLSNISAPADRRTALHDFYFNGLPKDGVGSVISIDNYGARGGLMAGQVRINQFNFTQNIEDWSPREFLLLTQSCPGPSCHLQLLPSFDKDVPEAKLFDPTFADPRATSFQTTFLPASVERLALGDLNTMNYASHVDPEYNVGDDQIQTPATNYAAAFPPGPSSLRTAIQGRLNAIGSALTPDQIVARAMSLSCAGCHLKSNANQMVSPEEALAHNLGGGLQLPPQAFGFVQVDEHTEPIPDDSTHLRSRFIANPAVTDVFLKYRAQIMTDFLSSVPGFERAGAWRSPQGAVVSVSSPVTQGASALEIIPSSGWTQIVSVPFSTIGLGAIQNMTVDLLLPTYQPNPFWLGQLTAFITIPSARIYNEPLGTANFTGLKLGAYDPVSVSLPADAQRALTYGVEDVTMTLVLNVPATTSPYFVDNIRFH